MSNYLNNKRYTEPFVRSELTKFTIPELLRIISTKRVNLKNTLIELLIATNKNETTKTN